MKWNKRTFLYLTLVFASCGSGTESQEVAAQQQLSDAECNNPDAPIACCFVNMPAKLNSIITITDSKEPGVPLVVSGTVFKSDGKTPWPDVLMYVYHTDNTGIYSKNGSEKGIQKWHGRLHGWGKTDAEGHYEIRTIRPSPYPDNQNPAHIHAVLKLPQSGEMMYIGDFYFDDDPITKAMLNSGRATQQFSEKPMSLKMIDGTWTGKRDIVLNKK